LSIDDQEMSIVSWPDQESEKTAPYAIGVRITGEGAELFHTGTYVGDDPVLKATFAGPEVVILPKREQYTPILQATGEADLHAAFDEPIDTDWPARSSVPVGLLVLYQLDC
jgi:hypothetical protein